MERGKEMVHVVVTAHGVQTEHIDKMLCLSVLDTWVCLWTVGLPAVSAWQVRARRWVLAAAGSERTQ